MAACSTSWCAGNCNSSCAGNTSANLRERNTDGTANANGRYNSCQCGNNCSNACSSCWGSCKGGCDGSSSGSSTSSCSACGTTCENNCATNCKTGCKTGCTGSCEGTCSGKCTGSCQTECNYGCISSAAMTSYRNLKRTEYINSANVLTIYRFIRSELERLNQKSPAEYDEEGKDKFEEEFKKENWANSEAFNTLIECMNNVKNAENKEVFTKEQDKITKIHTVRDEKGEQVIDGDLIFATLGDKVINNAKTIFGVKIPID